MRVGATNDGISVHAIAGSYVVLLGLDCTEEARQGLLGFAIERTDHTDDERYWLRGFKVFKETSFGVLPGQSVISLEHPFQTFLWSDFTAKPGYTYTYRICAMYNKPKKLEIRRQVSVTVNTEEVDAGLHAVFFNRGVAASQAYARRFGNMEPDRTKPDEPYWTWLSRGLRKAIVEFIEQANGPQFALHAAVYEFNCVPALEAFKRAVDSGVEVEIIYDRRGKAHVPPPGRKKRKRVWEATEEAAEAVGLMPCMKPRKTNSAIAHNKFIVLSKNAQPQEVWTGSTNFTWGGIFGQSNLGHVVRDTSVARAYFDYWTCLSDDPDYDSIRPANVTATPQPPDLPPPGITPIFFPRTDLAMMDWYVAQAERATESFFITAAFGLHKNLAQVLGRRADHLRYVLLETDKRGAQIETTDFDVKIAVGSYLDYDLARRQALVRWVRERTTRLNLHVRYAHTKFMIVDALTEDPLVVSGSANFSDASVKSNDENMLIIRGDKRVVDIYLGEFMRLFNHHYFRYLAKKLGWDLRGGGTVAELKDSDRWTDRYFDARKPSFKQRQLFRWKGPAQ
jgi:phosphatidylserine/phosphatidylglycerophosphate/cardiolipin synthase-like enzyme